MMMDVIEEKRVAESADDSRTADFERQVAISSKVSKHLTIKNIFIVESVTSRRHEIDVDDPGFRIGVLIEKIGVWKSERFNKIQIEPKFRLAGFSRRTG